MALFPVSNRLEEEPNTYGPPTFTGYDLYISNFDRPADYTWKIDRAHRLHRKRAFDIVGPRAQLWTQYPGIQALPRLSVDNQGLIFASLDLSRPQPIQGQPRPPPSPESVTPIPTIYYVLRDPNPSPQPRPIVRAHSSPSRTMFNYSVKFPSQLFHKDYLADYLSHVDGSVTLEVFVEPPSAVKHVHSRDGRLKWIVDNCQSRVRAEEREIVERQESPYFYSEERGYRMQAWLKTNRNERHETESLSVEIAFLSGEFDARLSPAFKHRATVTVCNPEVSQLTVTRMVEGDIAEDRVTRAVIPIADPLLIWGELLEVDVCVESDDPLF